MDVSHSFPKPKCGLSLFGDNHDTLTPAHWQEDQPGHRLKPPGGAEEEFLEHFRESRDVWHVPKTVCKYPPDPEAGLPDHGQPLRGRFQRDMGRVLVTDPGIALPRFEQGIEVRCRHIRIPPGWRTRPSSAIALSG